MSVYKSPADSGSPSKRIPTHEIASHVAGKARLKHKCKSSYGRSEDYKALCLPQRNAPVRTETSLPRKETPASSFSGPLRDCVPCIWFISRSPTESSQLSRRHHEEAQGSDFYRPSTSCGHQHTCVCLTQFLQTSFQIQAVAPAPLNPQTHKTGKTEKPN